MKVVAFNGSPRKDGNTIVPGSIYWNMGIGMDKGEVEKDEEGTETMKALGQNMAWLLKKINA